jgi:hypothetical protein
MMASRHGFAAVVVSVIVCISLVLSAFFCAFPWSMTAPAVAEAASASSSSSSGDTRAEVQAFVKTYIDAANKADVTTMMEMFSRKSGVTSIGDGDISRGWDDIRTDYDQMIGKEGSYKISVGSIDVMPLGSSFCRTSSSRSSRAGGAAAWRRSGALRRCRKHSACVDIIEA